MTMDWGSESQQEEMCGGGKPAWTFVSINRSYGVVKWEYNGSNHFILELGELVQVFAECSDWLFVRKESLETGIIPKNYIHIKSCKVIRQGETDLLVPMSPLLVIEIRDVLKEWHKLAKEYYLNRHGDFNGICRKIIQLHSCLKNILNPLLTVENQRELKKEVGEIIDSGNNLLKLDMTVREEHGDPLNSSVTSAIELFRRHQITQSRLNKIGNDGGDKGANCQSHSLLVTCVTFHWGILDEGFIRFFLYDCSGSKYYTFTEGGQITLKPSTPFIPTRFLFTDLGKRDRERTKVFLVAYVVRVGAMEYREDKRGNLPFSQKSGQQQMRRPWGVGAKDISHLFRDEWCSIEEELSIPYIPFEEHDSLRTALSKLLEPNTKDIGENKKFICTFTMLPDNSPEVSQILGVTTTSNVLTSEEHSLRLKANSFIVRKMGFPEVILPNDIRNDLYVTLLSGEFHRGSKTSDKNVEVTASLHNEKGEVIKNIILSGSGAPGQDMYKSVVYYHDDRPKWDENFKISLPMSIEDFSSAHLKFTFRHRSSSDAKDRGEKIFALAYMRLRLTDKGTAVSDDDHSLVVYKVDPKQYKKSDVSYLSLPPTRPLTGGQPPKCPGLSLSPKDIFHVRTTLCSTKFTQNVNLLELLQWSTTLAEKTREAAEKTNLAEESSRRALGELLLRALHRILNNVMEVSGEEIVKFLPDVFDALFTILVEPVESIPGRMSSEDSTTTNDHSSPLSDTCDRHVFECLIYIFGLILRREYENFNSVLSHYIEDGFSATLAYKKLIHELQSAIDKCDPQKILKIMKSIEFFFKFIIRSYSNRLQLRNMEIGNGDEEDEREFQHFIENLFHSISGLLRRNEDHLVGAQSGCLRYIPSIIELLSTCFPPPRLSELLFELVVCGPANKLVTYKLTAISSIVHSSLFCDPVCRTTLLPIVCTFIQHHLPGNDEDMRRKSQEAAKTRTNKKIVNLLGSGAAFPTSKQTLPGIPSHSEETKQSVDLLSDVLNILHRDDIGSTQGDITYIMLILLKPVILSIGTIGDGDILAGNMVAILLGIFRQMSYSHYKKLVYNLKRETNMDSLLKFFNDVLVVMKSLFQKSYFISSWFEMILLQNSVIVNVIEQFSETIRAEFQDKFEEQAWSNFFQCTVSFLTQESLQLENFSRRKRILILSRYGDMRRKACELIHLMWFSLGESKRVKFVPYMVGTFLDMTLVPESYLRRTTIPIFFDMMRCEFAQEGSFKKVENELVKRLVEFLEGGRGDPNFRDIFYETMRERCDHDNSGLRILGLEMVDMLSRLLEVLLEYREVIHEENPGNRMTCIVNLLDFSKEVGRKELYIRYLYKLIDLHAKSKNFTEAGFTLQLHSRQLEWVDEDVPSNLHSIRHPILTTQSELKEALYYDIIQYFNDAEMWECALDVCDELRQQYEESFNYTQLSPLLRRMAYFYENILKKIRCDPEYFRVGFFGKEFPSFLQNKIFVYRGKDYEKLSDFEARLLERFPHAELLRTLDRPSEDIRNSSKQLLQVCKVNAVMNSTKRMSGMKYAEESIRKYYRSNDINKFVYSRPIRREPRDPENEFASLWLDRYTLWTCHSFPGIMSWFPVIRETSVEIKPVVIAVETVEEMNETLRNLAISHFVNPDKPLGELTMKLNGILDAAVMGGIANYEKAFLTEDYLKREPQDVEIVNKLKSLIFSQSPIVLECLKIHERKAPDALQPLHKRLQERYDEMIKHIETKYGVRTKSKQDEILTRELERIQKKRLVQERKEDILKEPTSRHSDLVHRSSVSQVLSRGKGSMSSTVSLYSGLPQKVTKSMASIPRPRPQMIHRKSKQESSNHNHNHNHDGSSPGTGGGGGGGGMTRVFFGGSSMSKLTSISGGDFETDTIPIPSIQNSNSQRSSRIGGVGEYRNSLSWNVSTENRHSGISISSIQSMSASLGESSSENPLDNELEIEMMAPPLPPKQRDTNQMLDTKPPTPPPKKPPLRPS